MLSRYGTNNIIVMLGIAAVLIIAGYFVQLPWSLLLIVPGGLFALFTFWFFRDPERAVPVESLNDDSIVLSPADGKVVEIVREYEKNFFESEAIRISIFLSPLDVHVNRSPVTGNVKYVKYIPGEYIIANHPKASEKNEQSHFGVETRYGKVLFKQLVGIVARRIVYDTKEGDYLKAGDRFGMMKFGSRMDIFLPLETKIYINTGDKVKAVSSIIAKL